MKKVLVLGAAGNFGQRISHALAKDNLAIILAGRNEQKIRLLHQKIKNIYPDSYVEVAIFDINKNFSEQLKKLQPFVVINTCGPFQLTNYSIAENCIAERIHYIDLADARNFVTGINCLDAQANAANVLVVSGASTVPGLSSAVLEKYHREFSEIDSLIYGITPGQKTPRGLATAQSILTYLGKPLKPFADNPRKIYGWQDLYRQNYPEIGKRWMANCDVPDLDLLPQKYHIKNIHFSAGMETSILHLSMWMISWLVRLGVPLNLQKHAEILLRVSHCFDFLGTTDGGMHMLISGKDQQGKFKKIEWYLIGTKGDGPQIPCIPSIVLAKRLIAEEITLCGAMPCLGLITLEEYMHELKEFSIYCQAC